MSLQPPPSRLVAPDGTVAFGMFDAPLPEVDLDQARVRTLPLVPARLRLKQWQHFAVVHPDVVLTLAAVDAAITQVAWVQIVDRRTGKAFEHARRAPLLRVGVARSLWDEHTTAVAHRFAIRVHNHLSGGEHSIRVEAGTGAQRVQADLLCLHDLEDITPMVVSLPVGRGRAMYSHKVPLPVRGSLQVGEERFEFDPATCTAILDIHKAHYPRRTWWKWSTFVGFDDAGRRVAVNLTANVVEGDALHENGVWIDGALHPLAAARFELDGDPWRMRTADGAVDLRFETDGERTEDMRYKIIESSFVQRFGRYSGTIRVGDETIEVRQWFGVAEDHHAVW